MDEKNYSLSEYQDFAKQGWKKGCCREVFALGLAGETGEVLEVIKKSIRDEKQIDLTHLTEELGDVCWYIANLSTIFNLDLQTIINENVKKLKERYKL